MPLLGNGTLASLVPSLARVLVVGSSDAELEAGLAAHRCDVRRYAGPGDYGPYDAAIVVSFPTDDRAPADVLREIASGLAPDGRLILDASRLAHAAVGATVLRGSTAVGGDGAVSDTDAALYGRRSVIALAEAAGLLVLPTAADAVVLEAVPRPPEAPRATATNAASHVAPVPGDVERLRYAEREVAELRAFFRVIHDGSRRLQEEITRTRAALLERDLEIAALRAEMLASLGRATTDDERDRTIAVLRAQLADTEGRAADLESRLANVREALVELRDSARHPSTE